MEDETPRPRRTSLTFVISLVSGIVVLLGAVMAGLMWMVSRPEPDLDLSESSPPPGPPDDGADGGGGGTADADTPEANDAATAHDGGDSEVSTDGCDTDASCDGPSCDSQSCDAQPTCESGGGAVSAGVSLLSVLPLVTVDRLAPRRPLRRRAAVSRPARYGLAAIRGYRRHVSPRTRTRCRYVPSCSGYGAAVITRYGLAGGSRLALRRVRRCTKTVPMGTIDPPP